MHDVSSRSHFVPLFARTFSIQRSSMILIIIIILEGTEAQRELVMLDSSIANSISSSLWLKITITKIRPTWSIMAAVWQSHVQLMYFDIALAYTPAVRINLQGDEEWELLVCFEDRSWLPKARDLVVLEIESSLMIDPRCVIEFSMADKVSWCIVGTRLDDEALDGKLCGERHSLLPSVINYYRVPHVRRFSGALWTGLRATF